jgi:hypothetical protein
VLTVLAQADLEEQQEDRSPESGQHQGRREHLARHPADEGRAHGAEQNQHGGGPERKDP